jgi:phenylalanyl-tRNA synthetase beta subunit
MGELHPEVLEGHKLVHPVSLFEVDLSILGRRESASATFLVGRSWFEDSSEPSRG